MLRLFLVTYPRDRDYVSWCRSLVARRLAASINVAHVDSFFFWENRLNQVEEALLIIKTSSAKADELRKVLEMEHPYRVPAIIELAPEKVNTKYLEWVLETTGG
ncbi:MAG: divalent-cation tolerance protein CutA [Candidatus Caldarchaeum sp.]|jgi:periplasmic divalent cation tolerance protein